jgi:hypothetical protein
MNDSTFSPSASRRRGVEGSWEGSPLLDGQRTLGGHLVARRQCPLRVLDLQRTVNPPNFLELGLSLTVRCTSCMCSILQQSLDLTRSFRFYGLE